MSINEITTAAREIKELKKLREDLDAEIAALEDQIKAHMGEAEELTAGEYKIRWQAVTSTRIDTAKLRKDLPEIWDEYGKTTTTRRFLIN